MRPELILLEPLLPHVEVALAAHFDVHRAFDPAARKDVASRRAREIKALVTGGATGAENALLDLLPALEIIAISGIGTDAVDLDRARARGTRVTITPDLLTDDVADLAIGLLLATTRRICVADRYVRGGNWVGRDGLPLASKFSGKKLAVLGMGRVGRAVARRAAGFDLQIAYHDVRSMDDLPYRFMPDLLDMARWCDFFVVAAAGGAGSRNIVDASVLDAIGPRGVLVNVARGSVVDEAALVKALLDGRLGSAGLDVFVDEPAVPPQLFGLENVVLQPHRASATVETRTAMGELLIANLLAHFSGQQLKTPVV